jgi:prophage maintenance system killer protein
MNESETLSSKDIAFIIIFNRMKVEERGELFEVDEDDLKKIFNRMKKYDHIEDKRTRIIKKATRILAGITYYQPFGDGNKETALAATKLYLKRNGFSLIIPPFNKEEEVYDLLTKTIWKPMNDSTIFREVEEYLMREVKNVISFRF